MAKRSGTVLNLMNSCEDKWEAAEASGSFRDTDLSQDEITLFESAGFLVDNGMILLLFKDANKGAVEGDLKALSHMFVTDGLTDTTGSVKPCSPVHLNTIKNRLRLLELLSLTEDRLPYLNHLAPFPKTASPISITCQA